MFKADGSVAYYMIEPEMDDYEEAAASEGLEPGFSESESPRNTARAEAVDFDNNLDVDEMVYVEPGNISFEDSGNTVTINMDAAELMQESDGRSVRSENLLDATDIVGMEVDLADSESFGEVEDVMIGQDGKDAVALVVDNWDGANKERRALPVALESADLENETIRYDFSRDELSETGDFELDQYMDDM